MRINMNGKNVFGKFEYFTDGIVSTVNQLKQDSWGKQMDKLSKANTLKIGQAKKQSQACRLAKRIQEGYHTVDVIYLRSVQVGVRHFWKDKMDYVHTG